VPVKAAAKKHQAITDAAANLPQITANRTKRFNSKGPRGAERLYLYYSSKQQRCRFHLTCCKACHGVIIYNNIKQLLRNARYLILTGIPANNM
jgi:hypothetical protein